MGRVKFIFYREDWLAAKILTEESLCLSSYAGLYVEMTRPTVLGGGECTILNHGLSSFFFTPARNFYVRFGKKIHIMYFFRRISDSQFTDFEE